MLEALLVQDGHRVQGARSGAAALDLENRGHVRPDIVLSDYNLPNGIGGLDLVTRLREQLMLGDIRNWTRTTGRTGHL